jgi:eukaryotic-like serine/threonine-protein kinase
VDLPRAIGRYEVEDVIGQGGMGRVLLARDSVLGRRVAIKVMREDLGLPPEVRAALLARMRQEARAAAAVSHPNMVTLHDMGEEEPIGLYLVFEYVEGPTLRDAIESADPNTRTPSLRMLAATPNGGSSESDRFATREGGERGALEARTVARIAREVAGALDRAHAAGVIHRDVKPENILLSTDGAKITDFGIARMPDSTLTLQSTVMGTPAYSAPESLSAGTFSERSDQFALACTLYEALTGERAFPGDDPLAVATRVATEDPTPLRSVGGILDRASQVLLRGMAKDPARRFASCGELAEALTDALVRAIRTEESLRPPSLKPPPESAVLVVGSPRPSRRREIIAGFAALVVIGGALLFAFGGKRGDAATHVSPQAAGDASAAGIAPRGSARREPTKPPRVVDSVGRP